MLRPASELRNCMEQKRLRKVSNATHAASVTRTL